MYTHTHAHKLVHMNDYTCMSVRLFYWYPQNVHRIAFVCVHLYMYCKRARVNTHAPHVSTCTRTYTYCMGACVVSAPTDHRLRGNQNPQSFKEQTRQIRQILESMAKRTQERALSIAVIWTWTAADTPPDIHLSDHRHSWAQEEKTAEKVRSRWGQSRAVK